MKGSALIVGGGIAGLAAGSALTARGWSVEIWERSRSLPQTGTALGMWPEAMRALDEIGIGDRIRERGEYRAGARILRPNGTVMMKLGANRAAHLVTRPFLLEALYSVVPEGTVRWNTSLRTIDDAPEVDVLIGADGINSVVRGMHWPSATPRRLGTVAFRGTVPGHIDEVTETWGRSRLFGITPNDRDTTNWFACIRADLLDHRSSERIPAELLPRLYEGWHPAIADVLGKLAGGSVDRRDLYDLPPLHSYSRGRAVLLGDAAHAMAPNLGRGACESLVDAVALAEALDGAATIEDGLRTYDRGRRGPSQRVRRMSHLANKLSTARHLTGIRDTALHSAGRVVPQ